MKPFKDLSDPFSCQKMANGHTYRNWFLCRTAILIVSANNIENNADVPRYVGNKIISNSKIFVGIMTTFQNRGILNENCIQGRHICSHKTSHDHKSIIVVFLLLHYENIKLLSTEYTRLPTLDSKQRRI